MLHGMHEQSGCLNHHLQWMSIIPISHTRQCSVCHCWRYRRRGAASCGDCTNTILCIGHEKGYLLSIWVWKITCQRLDWMLQLSSGWKWKKYVIHVIGSYSMHYWRYMSLEVEGWWGLLLSPCLLITAVHILKNPCTYFYRAISHCFKTCIV